MNTIIFTYNSNPVTFLKGESIMVNATEMAKPFGKSAKHWLLNQTTKDFIQALSEVKNLTSADLMQVKRSGDVQEIWMHEDVAPEFARWLSPVFAIWCNDRIKELLTQGVNTDDDGVIARAMNVLHKRLQNSRQRLQILEGQNEMQQEWIRISESKAEYTDKVLQSKRTYTARQLAEEMGFRTAKAMHNALKEKGVLKSVGGTWVVTAKYNGKGYTKSRTAYVTHSDGSCGTRMTTVWTEKGRVFLHEIIKNEYQPLKATES